MLVMGVINGTILYDTLHNETCPLFVPYPVFYDYLNCTGESPCATFMSSNQTVRELTA